MSHGADLHSPTPAPKDSVFAVVAKWLGQIRKPSPLTWFAVALVLGHLMHQSQFLSRPTWLVVVIVASVGLIVAATLKARIVRVVFLMIASIGIGGLWTDWRQPQPTTGIGALIDLEATEPQLLRVRGFVDSITAQPEADTTDLFESFSFSETVLDFNVTVDSYHDGNQWLTSSGKLQCRLNLPSAMARETSSDEPFQAEPEKLPEDLLAIGQRVELLGLLSLPPPVKNPRQYDHRQHFWIGGIHGELSLKHSDLIQVIEPQPHWSYGGQRLRHAFKILLRRHVSDSQYPMAAAVMLGDRSLLSSSFRMQYAATGTIHVLAISGLHLGILAGALLWCGRWSFVPQRPILIATVALVVFYAWLVEFRPPIVRAAVLVSVMCLATLIGRRALTFNSLALGLVVVFWIQPWQLLSPGTQLSFLAVAAIVLFLNRRKQREANPLLELQEAHRTVWQRWLRQVGTNIRDVYLCGAAVFLACLPLVIHHFNLCAWIGLLVNPIVVLPMSVALLSGFCLFLFAPWCPPLADACGWICSRSLAIMNGTVETAFNWPGSHFWVTSPGQTWIVIFYLWGLVVLWLGADRIPRKFVIGGTVVLALLAYCFPTPQYPDRYQAQGPVLPLTLTFIDVGHGNAVLLRTPSGKVILFDAGSFPSARTASNRISGVLLAYGIRKIDQVVISHADLDHYNGVPELLKKFSIGEIVTPPQMLADESPYVRLLAEYIEQARIPVRTVAAGDTLHVEDGMEINVASPPNELFGDGKNANSLVLNIQYGINRALLTADIEGPSLKYLAEHEHGPFPLVQVPHHGSRSSQPQAFSQWSQPDIAVVSGLVHRIPTETLTAYEEANATVYITDRDGAVLVQMYPDGGFQTRGYQRQPWPTR